MRRSPMPPTGSEYAGHQPQDGIGRSLLPSRPALGVAVDRLRRHRQLHAARRLARRRRPMPTAWPASRSIYDPAYLTRQYRGRRGLRLVLCQRCGRAAAQARTPITDGAYGKPWVFRTKDLASLVERMPHMNRPGGVEQRQCRRRGCRNRSRSGSPSWVAPAIDKGANQPNAFIDPKSSESTCGPISRAARATT